MLSYSLDSAQRQAMRGGTKINKVKKKISGADPRTYVVGLMVGLSGIDSWSPSPSALTSWQHPQSRSHALHL